MAVLYRDPTAPAAALEYVVAASVSPAAMLLTGAECAWAPAAVIEWGPLEYATRFRALWSPSALCLRFDCTDHDAWHTMTQRDDPLWEEEVVEIFIDPTCTGTDYAEIEINPVNVVCDLRIRRPWPNLAGEIGWRFEGLESHVRCWHGALGEEGWTATAILPWTGFGPLCPEAAARVPPSPGDCWSFNVFRIKRPHGPAEPDRDAIYAAWSVPDGPSFHVPNAFRGLRFAELSGAGTSSTARTERNDP